VPAARPGRIVFVRHGQTDWNMSNRFQGHRDIPLNALGVAQAQRAAARFDVAGPVHLVGSDLDRASQTAQIFAEALATPLALDASFRETSGGRWEGMSHEEIARTDGPRLRRWRVENDVRPGTTGELMTEVGDRMTLGIQRHVGQVDAGGSLVVVSHGGAVRAAIGTLTGLPLRHWRALGVLDNCATATLEPVSEAVDVADWPLWRITSYNL
jgi:broad specificity phosphatase PhoE